MPFLRLNTFLLLMLTLDECKKILNTNKNKYNDEEIKQIRDFLYLIASFEIENNDRNKEEYEKYEGDNIL